MKILNLELADILFAVTLALIIFLVLLPFTFRGVDMVDDGVMFKPALDLMNGKMLFRDTFTQYGPLYILLDSLILRLLGPYLISLKLWTAFIYSLNGTLLYFISRKFTSKVLSLIFTLLWLCLSPVFNSNFYIWPNVVATFFITIAFFVFIYRTTTIPDLKTTFFIGILFALSTLSKQPFFIFFFIFSVFYLLLFFFRKINIKYLIYALISLWTGLILIGLILLIWLIANGALHDFFLQEIRIGYIWGRILGKDYTIVPYFYNPFLYIWVIVPLLYVFILIKSIWILHKSNNNTSAITMLGISLLGIATCLQYYPYPINETSHLYWALTPIFTYSCYLLYQYFFIPLYLELKTRKPLQFRTILYALMVVLLIISTSAEISNRIENGTGRLKTLNTLVIGPPVLQHIYTSKQDATYYHDIYTRIKLYLEDHPSKTFVIYASSASMYTTFTDKSVNILSFYADFSGFTSGVYPYSTALDNYVKVNKPLILTEVKNKSRLPGYYILHAWPKYNYILLGIDN